MHQTILSYKDATGSWIRVRTVLYPCRSACRPGVNWISLEPPNPDKKRFRGEALKWSMQVSATRQLFEKFGVAFVPGILINPVENSDGESAILTLGMGARWNFNKRMSWSVEWVPIVSGLYTY